MTSRKLTGYWLILPAALWLGLFFAIPFYSLLANSLYDPEGSVLTGYHVSYRFANFADAIRDSGPELWRSLWYAGLATAICLVLGYVLAYAIAFKAGKWRNLMLVLVIAPFFTSFLVRTLSWKLILADDGFIVDTLRFVHILGEDGRLLATPVAVIAGLVYNFLPFMVLPLYASLEKLDETLLEAAADLGCTPWRAFWQVTFPLSLPGVVAGCFLVFIPAVGEFVIPDLLGGSETLMIGKTLWTEFFNNRDWPVASAVAVILLLILVIPIVLFQNQQAKAQEAGR